MGDLAAKVTAQLGGSTEQKTEEQIKTGGTQASSLKDLEAGGVVTRKQFEEIPPRVEYSLTEHGKELWPILHRLAHWGKGEAFDGD